MSHFYFLSTSLPGVFVFRFKFMMSFKYWSKSLCPLLDDFCEGRGEMPVGTRPECILEFVLELIFVLFFPLHVFWARGEGVCFETGTRHKKGKGVEIKKSHLKARPSLSLTHTQFHRLILWRVWYDYLPWSGVKALSWLLTHKQRALFKSSRGWG